MPRKNPDQHHSFSELASMGHGSCEDFFELSAEGEESELLDQGYDVYYGRNVMWLGREGEMFRAEPRYIEAIEGNIFDENKLAAAVNCIETTPSRVPFIAPVADVTMITPQDIRESFEYEPDDPWTSGDEELDSWIRDPDEFVEEQLDCDDYDTLDEWKVAIKKLQAEMQGTLADAVVSRQGDLGSMRVQIRDGNHRAFGALAAGEPYVYVWLIDWALHDARNGLRPELAEEIE